MIVVPRDHPLLNASVSAGTFPHQSSLSLSASYARIMLSFVLATSKPLQVTTIRDATALRNTGIA